MSANAQEFPFVRIIELPAVKMVRSGTGNLETFNQWWSAVAAQDKSSLFPRDFMWFNPQLGDMEWLYASPQGMNDTGGYAVFDFPGGLFAVAACNDNDEDIQKTSGLIHEWVAQSEVFGEVSNEDSPNPRYEMGHVITPLNSKEIMGYHQMDLFVPVVWKKS